MEKFFQANSSGPRHVRPADRTEPLLFQTVIERFTLPAVIAAALWGKEDLLRHCWRVFLDRDD